MGPGNPARGAQALSRLAGPSPFHAGQSAKEVADALISSPAAWRLPTPGSGDPVKAPFAPANSPSRPAQKGRPRSTRHSGAFSLSSDLGDRPSRPCVDRLFATACGPIA